MKVLNILSDDDNDNMKISLNSRNNFLIQGRIFVTKIRHPSVKGDTQTIDPLVNSNNS